jgi:hypothetical protein
MSAAPKELQMRRAKQIFAGGKKDQNVKRSLDSKHNTGIHVKQNGHFLILNASNSKC